MEADGSDPRRLSPAGVADYSPAWSPRGDLIACASGSGEAGKTDLYVMAPDGTGRRLVVEDGGWPCFAADGRSLFFHSQRGGKWAVWKVGIDGSGLERVTPTGVDAYCPSASADGRRLVASVDRGGHRQIALIDLASGRGDGPDRRGDRPLEPRDHARRAVRRLPQGEPRLHHAERRTWGAPPGNDLRLLRLAGAFPAFSPDGRKVALTGGNFARLDVMNVDGSARKTLHSGDSRALFSLSWSHTATGSPSPRGRSSRARAGRSTS